MRSELIVTDYQLRGIEDGAPLCVGGLNRAFHRAGSRPDLPAWVISSHPLTEQQIATLRSEGTLHLGGEYELRLAD